MPLLGVITSSKIALLTEGDRQVFTKLEESTDWDVRIIVWDEDESDLLAFDAFIFRSCWDYHLHFEAFQDFLSKIEATGKKVINPLPVLRKNAHKFYLAELPLVGVPIIPTVFCRKGDGSLLSSIMEDNHWEKVVVKPAVSAASHHTQIVVFSELHEKTRLLQHLFDSRDMLVQPFIPEIQGIGELSTVCFSNGTSYSVRKTPIDGDFRIQKEFGGIYKRYELAAELKTQIAKIWDKINVNKEITFARIDGVVIKGQFYVMEIEMIEPDLYIELYPEHIQNFVQSITNALNIDSIN
jgi:glutathione synthase/RimK-type ligase-like ATP-grasp enzyme